LSGSAVRHAVAAIACGLAASLLWFGASVHLRRACVVRDTPYLPLCGDAVAESDDRRVQTLRGRLAADPGDAGAWIELTNLETGAHEPALLRASSILAPNDPNVLMWRAGEALAHDDLPKATGLLVALVEFRSQGEAAQTLARLVASGRGTALLRPYLPSASRWLPAVLANVTSLKLPLGSALPLLAEASAKGAVGKPTVQAYVRDLKNAGGWGDAYSLWIAQQRRPVPLLHNGRFDQPFEANGFDWEVTPTLPSRAGALVAQRSSGDRGQVLDVQFTGKALVVPLIRQYVFVPPGQYLLRGQYMSSRLRSEQGLAWAARCSNDKAANLVAGRSGALMDTGGRWQNFQFVIAIPPDCGQVVSLQLETFAPFEAATGLKGRAAFDGLELLPQGV
jgi:hypothetical protein